MNQTYIFGKRKKGIARLEFASYDIYINNKQKRRKHHSVLRLDVSSIACLYFFHGAVSGLDSVPEKKTKPFHYIESKGSVTNHNFS